jgi:archaemetzincin
MTAGFSDPPLTEFLSRHLAQYVDRDISIEECAGTLDFAFSPGRNQYSSSKILSNFLHLCPAGAEKIIGIVNVDLYIPVLTFVFGQAQLGGRAAVVSIARLHQSFYGCAQKRVLLYHRTLKEILHELGHTYNLTHCENPSCIMTHSYTVGNIDRKSSHFCFQCKGVFSRNTAVQDRLSKRPKGKTEPQRPHSHGETG